MLSHPLCLRWINKHHFTRSPPRIDTHEPPLRWCRWRFKWTWMFSCCYQPGGPKCLVLRWYIHSWLSGVNFSTEWVSAHHVPGGEKPIQGSRRSACLHFPEMHCLLTESGAPPPMSLTGASPSQVIHLRCISFGSGRPVMEKEGKLTINLFLLSPWPTQDRWCCQAISSQWCIFNVL